MIASPPIASVAPSLLTATPAPWRRRARSHFVTIIVQVALVAELSAGVAESEYTATPGSRAHRSDRQPLRLAELPALPFSPAFSPDGNSIAFHDARDSSGSRICIVPRDGGVSLSLTEGDDSAATWFPDGNSILYLHRAVVGVSGGDLPGIYRINVSSKNKERIPGSEAANDPALSPDGRFIAAPSKDFQHLMLFDIATGKWRGLAKGSFLRTPSWSSDSQSIYFKDYYQGSEQPIYRVRISDGHIDTVATSAQFQRSDVFHGYLFHGLGPDGQPIVSLPRNKSDIFALDLDLP